MVWVALGFSSYEDTEIADYQAVNDPSHPLNSLSESDMDYELVKTAKTLDSMLEDADRREGEPTDVGTIESTVGNSAALDDRSKERIWAALAEGKWAWRSIDALSATAGLEPAQTLAILRGGSDIVLGRGKSGKQIARLKSRIVQ